MWGGCIIRAAKQENDEPHSPGNTAISFSFTFLSKQDKTAWFAWAHSLSGLYEDENKSWEIIQRLGSQKMHFNTAAGLIYAISCVHLIWMGEQLSHDSFSLDVVHHWQPLWPSLFSPEDWTRRWLSKHNHTWSLQQSIVALLSFFSQWHNKQHSRD